MSFTPPYTSAPPGYPLPQASAPAKPSVLGAVRFAFSGRHWTNNLLIGCVLSLIPIAGPLVLGGFLAEVHQRLLQRRPEPAPRLDLQDFQPLLMRGVVPFVASIAGGFCFAVLVMLLGAAIAISIVLDQETGQSGLAIMVGVAIALFGSAVGAVLLTVTNALRTRAELTQDFGQTFDLKELWEYSRATWRPVLLKTLIFIPVAIALFLGGVLLCYFGVYPAMVALQIAALHLRFQIYEAARADGLPAISLKLSEPLPSEATRLIREQMRP